LAKDSSHSALRTAAAIFIGVLGAVVIWIATPYNNFVLRNTYIADTYLPLGALLILLLLAMLINPVLRLIHPGCALKSGQLAIILGILLIASVVPGVGLMRTVPSSIAAVPRGVREDPVLADEFAKMDLPRSLYTDELGLHATTPAADGYVEQLQPGEPVPWSAWVGPLCTWGALIVCSWLLMIGLSMIVLPQWRDTECLPFPLLQVQQELIAEPEKGRLLAPLFRKRLFWMAAGGVLLLRALSGLNSYFPESVPQVPLQWNLGNLFTEEPWRYLNSWFYQGAIYFLVVGIAFFTPNRISFSVWFLIVAYYVYELIGKAYMPPYNGSIVREHRLGALVALAVCIVWLGRQRWAEVFASLFRRPRHERDRNNRVGGAMFVMGCVGVFVWLLWVRVQPGFAALFTVFGFIVTLVICRVVAETGLPFIRVRAELLRVVRLLPANVIAATSIYFSVLIGVIFTVASRLNGGAVSMHAMALMEREGSGGRRWQKALLMLGVLVVGLLVAGVAHLHVNYHNASSIDGEDQPLNSGSYIWIRDAFWGLKDLHSGALREPAYARQRQVAFGFSMAVVLFMLCLLTPRWPLHPIGMLLVGSWLGGAIWESVFIGWLLKQLIIRFGGPRLYRSARSFFLGLIMGEAFAAVVWAVVPVVLLALGQTYRKPVVPMLF
jgi:hypothetical protein